MKTVRSLAVSLVIVAFVAVMCARPAHAWDTSRPQPTIFVVKVGP